MTNISFGYTIVYVPDVPAAIDFYVRAFGFRPRFITPEGDYGELDTGTVTLAFAAETLAESHLADAGGFTPLSPSTPPVGVSLTMLSDDVPAAVAEALDAGATAAVAPTTMSWGQTVAYVRDPTGLLVEVATPMPA